jgi:hypothetical protein
MIGSWASRHHLSEKFISNSNISVIEYKMEQTKGIFPENMIDGFWETIKRHKLLIFIIVVLVAIVALFETEKKEKPTDTKKMEDIEKEEDVEKALPKQLIKPEPEPISVQSVAPITPVVSVQPVQVPEVKVEQK